jgi:tetratricopeptide (TPR) repeat protein
VRCNEDIAGAESLLQQLCFMDSKNKQSLCTLELGSFFEQQNLWDHALACYTTCCSDVVLEKRYALLVRLGKLDFATCLPVVGPLSAKEAFRLFGVGRMPSSGYAINAAIASSVYFNSGQVLSGLSVLMFRKDVLLHYADSVRRVVQGVLGLGAMQLHSLSNVLSDSFLKQCLLNCSQDCESGVVTERVNQAVAWMMDRDRIDWRVMLNLSLVAQDDANHMIVRAAETCDANQRWKVWLDASVRFEGKRMRQYVAKSESEAPAKSRVLVLLEAARREADNKVASAILEKASTEEAFHWKVQIERALLAQKNGDLARAVTIVKDAIARNPQIGRLWALLARLSDRDSSAQRLILLTALEMIPKSGELWTELGRLEARELNWAAAEKCWRNAVNYTPQFGDVFFEMMRCKLLRAVVSRFGISAKRGSVSAEEILQVMQKNWNTSDEEQMCVLSNPNHGLTFDRISMTMGRYFGSYFALHVLATAKVQMMESLLDESNACRLLIDVLYESENAV